MFVAVCCFVFRTFTVIVTVVVTIGSVVLPGQYVDVWTQSKQRERSLASVVFEGWRVSESILAATLQTVSMLPSVSQDGSARPLHKTPAANNIKAWEASAAAAPWRGMLNMSQHLFLFRLTRRAGDLIGREAPTGMGKQSDRGRRRRKKERSGLILRNRGSS